MMVLREMLLFLFSLQLANGCDPPSIALTHGDGRMVRCGEGFPCIRGFHCEHLWLGLNVCCLDAEPNPDLSMYPLLNLLKGDISYEKLVERHKRIQALRRKSSSDQEPCAATALKTKEEIAKAEGFIRLAQEPQTPPIPVFVTDDCGDRLVDENGNEITHPPSTTTTTTPVPPLVEPSTIPPTNGTMPPYNTTTSSGTMPPYDTTPMSAQQNDSETSTVVVTPVPIPITTLAITTSTSSSTTSSTLSSSTVSTSTPPSSTLTSTSSSSTSSTTSSTSSTSISSSSTVPSSTTTSSTTVLTTTSTVPSPPTPPTVPTSSKGTTDHLYSKTEQPSTTDHLYSKTDAGVTRDMVDSAANTTTTLGPIVATDMGPEVLTTSTTRRSTVTAAQPPEPPLSTRIVSGKPLYFITLAAEIGGENTMQPLTKTTTWPPDEVTFARKTTDHLYETTTPTPP